MKQVDISGKPIKLIKHKEIWIGILAALLVVIILSPFASSSPDGLERVAEDLAFLETAEGQEMISSPLPDYAIPGMENGVLSGILAGAAGTLLTFVVMLALAKFLFVSRNKSQGSPENNGNR